MPAHVPPPLAIVGSGDICLRLSNKWENLQAALALHFAYYNFCRIHGKLRVTPAMESRITFGKCKTC
jgi:hypothetical protein